MEIVQSLIAKLTTYNFECEGGPLHNCVDYQKLCVYALMAERDCANARAATHLADAYSMRDQRDALAKDAERYRWLRGHMFFTKREWGTYAEFPESMIFAVPVSAENKKQNDAIDAAIDAAKEKP